MKAPSMRYHFILIGFLLMATAVSIVGATTPSEKNENRVALVIGNSAYHNTPALPNLKNDAQAIGQALKRLGFDADIQTDLTKTEMDALLRRFGDKIEGADAAVFYYAGHGLQVDGQCH